MGSPGGMGGTLGLELLWERKIYLWNQRSFQALGWLGKQFLGLNRWSLFGKTRGWGRFHSCVNSNLIDHSHSSAILGSSSRSPRGSQSPGFHYQAVFWLILELSQRISPFLNPSLSSFFFLSSPHPYMIRSVTVLLYSLVTLRAGRKRKFPFP